ncbi:hypothetical protein LTR74_016742 [Friedmanniomyces endolithicus]|nr:hypothetical protein LTR74_016742 [Friedmanniomyces endolithicus]
MVNSRTVDGRDLVAVDLVFPHYVSELYKVYYSARHQSYYLSGQMPDEVWTIKMCDTHGSAEEGISEFKSPVAVTDQVAVQLDFGYLLIS